MLLKCISYNRQVESYHQPYLSVRCCLLSGENCPACQHQTNKAMPLFSLPANVDNLSLSEILVSGGGHKMFSHHIQCVQERGFGYHSIFIFYPSSKENILVAFSMLIRTTWAIFRYPELIIVKAVRVCGPKSLPFHWEQRRERRAHWHSCENSLETFYLAPSPVFWDFEVDIWRFFRSVGVLLANKYCLNLLLNSHNFNFLISQIHPAQTSCHHISGPWKPWHLIALQSL